MGIRLWLQQQIKQEFHQCVKSFHKSLLVKKKISVLDSIEKQNQENHSSNQQQKYTVDAVEIFQGIYKAELIEIVVNPLAFTSVIKWKFYYRWVWPISVALKNEGNTLGKQ